VGSALDIFWGNLPCKDVVLMVYFIFWGNLPCKDVVLMVYFLVIAVFCFIWSLKFLRSL